MKSLLILGLMMTASAFGSLDSKKEPTVRKALSEYLSDHDFDHCQTASDFKFSSVYLQVIADQVADPNNTLTVQESLISLERHIESGAQREDQKIYFALSEDKKDIVSIRVLDSYSETKEENIGTIIEPDLQNVVSSRLVLDGTCSLKKLH